jgi:hypothetical protein
MRRPCIEMFFISVNPRKSAVRSWFCFLRVSRCALVFCWLWLGSAVSLHIRPHDINQLLRPLAFAAAGFGAEHVKADVAFDDFVHQAVDGAAGSRDELKDVRALLIRRQRFLDSDDLAANAPDARQKLGFGLTGMPHSVPQYINMVCFFVHPALYYEN